MLCIYWNNLHHWYNKFMYRDKAIFISLSKIFAILTKPYIIAKLLR